MCITLPNTIMPWIKPREQYLSVWDSADNTEWTDKNNTWTVQHTGDVRKHANDLLKADDYFNRINNPQTEEDYLQVLIFNIRIIMLFATQEYRTWWAGIIEFGTEVDFEKVKANLRAQCGWFIEKIGEDVQLICERFSVEYPTSKEVSQGKISFKEWFLNVGAKIGKKDFEYPDFIFELLENK